MFWGLITTRKDRLLARETERADYNEKGWNQDKNTICQILNDIRSFMARHPDAGDYHYPYGSGITPLSGLNCWTQDLIIKAEKDRREVEIRAVVNKMQNEKQGEK